MELKEAIRKRRSVREFTEEDVNMEYILEILEYANLAPSAGNLQARDFIVVRDEKTRRSLADAAFHQEFIAEAPLDIVVCANLKRISPYGDRGINLYCIQDSAASIEHILLVSLEYGLSTCWVGAFNEDKVSKILNLPSYVRPVAIIPIGHARRIPRSTPRISMEKLIHLNEW